VVRRAPRRRTIAEGDTASRLRRSTLSSATNFTTASGRDKRHPPDVLRRQTRAQRGWRLVTNPSSSSASDSQPSRRPPGFPQQFVADYSRQVKGHRSTPNPSLH
jgi:hypothetical protein